MGNFEPWQSTTRQRSTRTGMMAISGILLIIFGSMAAFLLWTFRVQRPAQAVAGTATAHRGQIKPPLQQVMQTQRMWPNCCRSHPL
jgi:hypothetical protein